MVDDFVRSIKDNTYQIPLNDRSKELLRENEILKSKIEILTNPEIMRKNHSSIGDQVSLSPDLQDELKRNQAEIKSYLE